MRLRQLIVPLILIVTLMGLLHWFVYSMTIQTVVNPPLALKIFFIAGWLLIPASLILGMSPLKKNLLPLIMLGYVWLGTFMIALLSACIQLLISWLWRDMPSQWMLIVIPVIALWSLRINFMGPQVVKHTLRGPELMHSTRMVQISDLHVGQTILGKKWLQSVVDKILHLNPDILVVTGDLADGKFDTVAPMLEPLAQIRCQKFYVTGNHEYISGADWEPHLKKLGFEVLHNTHSLIRKTKGVFLIAGVPDQHVKRFAADKQSLPDQALKTSERVGYKILLAHEPSSVFDIKKETCDLILAGHTHGGQIFPFGVFVRLQQPVSAGFKIIKGIMVFAHQGTGFWGPPMRWFTRSEIVEFTWQ